MAAMLLGPLMIASTLSLQSNSATKSAHRPCKNNHDHQFGRFRWTCFRFWGGPDTAAMAVKAQPDQGPQLPCSAVAFRARVRTHVPSSPRHPRVRTCTPSAGSPWPSPTRKDEGGLSRVAPSPSLNRKPLPQGIAPLPLDGSSTAPGNRTAPPGNRTVPPRNRTANLFDVLTTGAPKLRIYSVARDGTGRRPE